MSELKKVLYFCFFIVLVMPVSVPAQQAVRNTDIKTKRKLTPKHFTVLIDTSNHLSVQQVINQSSLFANNISITGQLNNQQTYWLKLRFRNSQPQKTKYFLYIGQVSLLDVYVVQNKQVIEHQTEGLLRPFSQRKTIGGNQAQAWFKCPAQKEVTILIRAQGLPGIFFSIMPQIATEAFWQQSKQTTDLGQGIFQGLLWMMFFYTLFMFISLKDITYFYYAGYVFCISVFFLSFYQYTSSYIPFFGNRPQFNVYFPLILHPAFLLYYVLMYHFTNLPNKFLKTRRYLLFWIRVNIGISVGAFVLAAIDVIWLDFYNSVLDMIELPPFILFLIAVYRTKSLLARYFVLGSACMIAGGMVSMVAGFIDIPNYQTIIFLQVGIAAEIVVFSMGLSIRFKLKQDEVRKAQTELIEQLRQTEELQENYSKELEVTVEERTTELQQKNEELGNAYTHITDSVHYARRIQQSILAHPNEIARHFKGLFIFFEPKDIVSGDFYWFAQTQNKLILAAIDCTGHGVPGAFMTIMGNDFLNEIVNSQQITQPAGILEELDKKITLNLQKQTGASDVNDGMDMAIVTIDLTQNTLEYAGAKNPLWYVSNNKMQVIKASKFPIGSAQYPEEKVFENHLIDLKPNDVFYMFSDGFQDQFGGKLDKKYMKRNFRQLLHQISASPLNKQGQMMKKEFEDWKHTTPQTDDVLVIGFQVS